MCAVWAEVASFFPAPAAAEEAMGQFRVTFSPITLPTALAPSRAWRMYRDRGGRRSRLVADFLIGAHALSQPERLLTRDRGLYRAYFSSLRVLDPAPTPGAWGDSNLYLRRHDPQPASHRRTSGCAPGHDSLVLELRACGDALAL